MNRKSIRRLAILSFVLSLAAVVSAAADSRIERDLALAPGGRFVLDTDSGSVSVVGTSRSGAHVVIISSREDIESLYTFEFRESDGQVEIEVERKGKLSSWFSWTKGAGLKFRIEVPAETELSIDTAGGRIEVESIDGEVELDTSGGSIEVRRIRGSVLADTSGGSITVEDVDGDVEADTSGGSIEIRDVRGEVSADTSGGSIRIEGATGDILADTSGGGIRISGAGGRVYADTSGGSVTVALLAGNDRGGSLSTSGGGIRVTLDPQSNLEIDAVASGGSVVSDVPISVHGRISKGSLKGRMGGGGELLKLRASGGTIRIESN